MQTSGLSELAPKFTVYNGSLQGLNTTCAPNSLGATISATINVTAGQGYYIRVGAANAGAGSAGAYGLQLNFGGPGMYPFATPDPPIASQPDQGGGSMNESKGAHLAPDTNGDTFETGSHVRIPHPNFQHRFHHTSIVSAGHAGLHSERRRRF
jgi:hypothetical protein